MQTPETKRYTIYTQEELVEVSRNPENADMTHPYGERHDWRYYVIAEVPHGDRWRWSGGHLTPEEALAHYRVAAPPVELWQEHRPAYGSEAYLEYGQEDDLIQEARELEDERWGL